MPKFKLIPLLNERSNLYELTFGALIDVLARNTRVNDVRAELHLGPNAIFFLFKRLRVALFGCMGHIEMYHFKDSALIEKLFAMLKEANNISDDDTLKNTPLSNLFLPIDERVYHALILNPENDINEMTTIFGVDKDELMEDTKNLFMPQQATSNNTPINNLQAYKNTLTFFQTRNVNKIYLHNDSAKILFMPCKAFLALCQSTDSVKQAVSEMRISYTHLTLIFQQLGIIYFADPLAITIDSFKLPTYQKRRHHLSQKKYDLLLSLFDNETKINEIAFGLNDTIDYWLANDLLTNFNYPNNLHVFAGTLRIEFSILDEAIRNRTENFLRQTSSPTSSTSTTSTSTAFTPTQADQQPETTTQNSATNEDIARYLDEIQTNSDDDTSILGFNAHMLPPESTSITHQPELTDDFSFLSALSETDFNSLSDAVNFSIDSESDSQHNKKRSIESEEQELHEETKKQKIPRRAP